MSGHPGPTANRLDNELRRARRKTSRRPVAQVVSSTRSLFARRRRKSRPARTLRDVARSTSEPCAKKVLMKTVFSRGRTLFCVKIDLTNNRRVRRTLGEGEDSERTGHCGVRYMRRSHVQAGPISSESQILSATRFGLVGKAVSQSAAGLAFSARGRAEAQMAMAPPFAGAERGSAMRKLCGGPR